jgi:TolB-like protein
VSSEEKGVNMKKIILLISLIAGMSAVLFAQNAALPRLAVVEFTTNVNTEKAKADAVTVRNLVESQMVATRKYQIITRSDIDQLLANQRIQVSSISSAENIKKLQLQNISYILTGSVDAMGSDYAVTVRVLDVSTGQFSHSDNDLMGGGSRDLFNGVNTLMSKFVAGMSSDASGRVTQTGTGQRSGSYRIGDTGPGGGIIFAAEGSSYMEVSRLLGDYTWDRAIQVAKEFHGGDYSDWYLPSQSELNLIYQNLQKSGVVNLGTSVYWSSSQTGNSNAWYQYFSNGAQDASRTKINTFSVRAVRAF